MYPWITQYYGATRRNTAQQTAPFLAPVCNSPLDKTPGDTPARNAIFYRLSAPLSSQAFRRFSTQQVGLAVTLYNHIREILGLKLYRNNNYLAWGFLWFSSVPLYKHQVVPLPSIHLTIHHSPNNPPSVTVLWHRDPLLSGEYINRGRC
jgi:hypothetical protein